MVSSVWASLAERDLSARHHDCHTLRGKMRAALPTKQFAPWLLSGTLASSLFFPLGAISEMPRVVTAWDAPECLDLSRQPHPVAPCARGIPIPCRLFERAHLTGNRGSDQ